MFRNNNYGGNYMPLLSGARAYVKVDAVDTGSFPGLEGKSDLVMRVGPRHCFMGYGFDFKKGEHPNHTWEFKYQDAHRSSLVICLFKKRIFGGDEEIGEIELKLSAFEPDTIVTKEYTLKPPDPKNIPARVRISIHLSEDGSMAFSAPAGGKLLCNPEIPHATTYFK
ncbi:hypothetical protein TVAG_444990 [Trichomonas vaginalis G3]|uniref:Uncharacterized protein n=1 Tax=Trichomonas vaginalis (strain ATCC PRA-98 / G3) TaxID=412133 RepID=A2FZT9_TRIV3|nr:C2 domain (calcium/lipid-binding domain, CaLB) family [Trichomonas vaginalis G3]EAX89580.1 hypothetical protein TVAG_444990 [Trichomonas vaginalis G3]KAI5496096.1 C2 domain (calcium/lipid-binding domain, CaLB) family [Trichomonas vaginalis G3]|eukprot:XP_001302510.1 hypothetical protein [Trichomonas vaginalis G3]